MDIDNMGEVHSIQTTRDGGFVLAVEKGLSHEAELIKADSEGEVIWKKTFGGTGLNLFNSVQATFDGGYVLAGSTSSKGPGDNDAWLIRTNSEGVMIWEKTFGGENDDGASSIQQISDGCFILTGWTGSSAWLIKTDSDGNELWNRTFSESDSATSVLHNSDGGYIITGSTSSRGAGGSDAWLIKTDSDGNIVLLP